MNAWNVSIATIRRSAKFLKPTLRPYLEMVWAFSFGKRKKRTKGENRLVIGTKQVQDRARYQKWCKFLKAPVRHFRRFITPKWKGSDSRAAIGVKMSIDRNA
jgi:hypothetical protein